jgi:citrate synthase
MIKGTNGYIPGLAGVVAAQTKLSHVDGQLGELIIGGFPVAELAQRASFEEVVYLLWHDRLPNQTELQTFAAELAALRPLPSATLSLLENIAAENVSPMDALRMAASTLSLGLADEGQAALALVARMPTVVATYWRLRHGRSPLDPNPELSHAANYLYMLTGEIPDEALTRGLETYLNTVVDHGLNASPKPPPRNATTSVKPLTPSWRRRRARASRRRPKP